MPLRWSIGRGSARSRTPLVEVTATLARFLEHLVWPGKRGWLRSGLAKALLRSWRHWTKQKPPFDTFSQLFLCGLALALVSCGGGNSPSAPSPTPNVTMLLQDAPADGVAAFDIDVTAVSLNGDGGEPVSLSSPGQAMELRHMQLSPTVAVEAFTSQAGNYKSLTLTLANPRLTVLNASGQIVRLTGQTTPSATLAASNVTIPSSVTLGYPGHVNLILDFDLGHSLSTDKNGNYVIRPVINASVLGGASPSNIRGALAMVIATFFNGPNVLSQVPINALGQGASNQQFIEVQLHDSGAAIPVAVNSSTVVDGALGGLSNLRLGQLIYVSAQIQDSGIFLASSIAAGPPNLSQHYQGPVTGVQKDKSGNVSLDVVVQN